MDYEKAFDSVQTQAILTSLQEQGIEDVYIEMYVVGFSLAKLWAMSFSSTKSCSAFSMTNMSSVTL